MKYFDQDCSQEEKVAKFLFNQIAVGLDYLHNELKIAHRDIKPENIYYLSDTNRAKIGDFTLAIKCETEEFEVQEEAGSVPFMPPECFTTESYKPKPMDIWAFGVTLYAYITLENPFFEADMQVIKENIKNKTVEYPDLFSEDLKDLLSKIFVKDPSQRITISEILQHRWF